MFLFFLVFSFLLGAIIGSFTNCFIWRLHKDESLWGRSYCPHCRHQIAWYDNIPILSFFILGRRCRYCRKKISWQYPIVELSTALLFAGAFSVAVAKFVPEGLDYYSAYLLSDPLFAVYLVKLWLMIFVAMVIFVFDWRWYLIPDKVVLPASALILVLNLFLGFPWLPLLLSGFLGGGFFLAQFVLSRGRWIGGGDIRLGLFWGLAWGSLGYLGMFLLLTYCLGSVIGLGLIAIGKKHWSSKVPLGVFMSLAAVIMIFFSSSLAVWFSELTF